MSETNKENTRKNKILCSILWEGKKCTRMIKRKINKIKRNFILNIEEENSIRIYTSNTCDSHWIF